MCANSSSLHRDQAHAGMLRITAVEGICRMHGGSQSQLIRCSDDEYYVVKFQNNPQGARILANELMGTLLARELGLPTAEMAIIDVPRDVIRASKDMTIQLERGRNFCHEGLCFGSRCPRDGRSTKIWLPARVFDFPFEGLLRQTENLSEFAGMLVFDKWTGNTDDRQVILVPNFNPSGHRVYFALMIDQGFCFNGLGWDFPDVPKHGLCPVRGAYSHITGLTVFEPWLNRLEQEINRQTLEDVASQVPPEWYEQNACALSALLTALDERRVRVRELLFSTRKSLGQFFPAWPLSNAASA
jgi:HipA-like kinase